MQQKPLFQTILITPHWKQFVINELPLLLLCISGLIYAGMDGMPFAEFVLIIVGIISLMLLYSFCYLRKIKYLIGSEQLVVEHGIFQRKVDYLELYRIVDFNEHQTFMQQLFSMKTITIFSGDRSTPSLDIIGVKANNQIVPMIRERVIISRRNNSIYEITNR